MVQLPRYGSSRHQLREEHLWWNQSLGHPAGRSPGNDLSLLRTLKNVMTDPRDINRTAWKHFFLGKLCLVFPIVTVAWWIYVSTTHDGTHAEILEAYQDVYPSFMRHPRPMTWIRIGFCGMAAWFAFRGLDGRGIVKVFNLILLGFSGLLGFWLLFSLM